MIFCPLRGLGGYSHHNRAVVSWAAYWQRMFNAHKGWAPGRLEKVMTCLEDGLRHAGPQFSIGTTRVPPGVRMLRRAVTGFGQSLPPAIDTAISVRIDESEAMTLVFHSGLDPIEQLADLLDQVQDVVMESRAELWPRCPLHDHQDPLLPRPDQEWVEWECPETGEAIARFGELQARLT